MLLMIQDDDGRTVNATYPTEQELVAGLRAAADAIARSGLNALLTFHGATVENHQPDEIDWSYYTPERIAELESRDA